MDAIGFAAIEKKLKRTLEDWEVRPEAWTCKKWSATATNEKYF